LSLRDLVKGAEKKELKHVRILTSKQVRSIKKRGYDAERELVQKLRRSSFDALRVPVSAPSNEPFPDVFAVKGDSILAFEVKSQERYVYFKADQVNKLLGFLNIHRYYPRRYAVLAAKFRYKDWNFLIVNKRGDYSIRANNGITFSNLVETVS
jgi:Holliday junction resolvase